VREANNRLKQVKTIKSREKGSCRAFARGVQDVGGRGFESTKKNITRRLLSTTKDISLGVHSATEGADSEKKKIVRKDLRNFPLYHGGARISQAEENGSGRL